MLNEEDKKQIAKLIAEQLKIYNSSKKMSKSEKEAAALKTKEERERRKAYLKMLRESKQETLAQAIEGMKLAFEDSKVGKTLENVAKPFTSSAAIASKAVLSSRLSKDFLTTLMYSNPITALMAQNSDLLKGIGKAGLQLGKGLGGLAFKGASGLYSMLKKKPEDPLDSLSNGMFPSNNTARKILDNKTNGPKYINVQNALFTGGKNYILNAGGFAAYNQEENQSVVPKIASVGGAFKNKAIAGISKGVEGISAAMKTVNTVLAAIKTKQILIAGAILLGVAAIVTILNKFKNWTDRSEQRKNSADAGNAAISGQWAGKLPSYMSQVNALPKMGTYLEKNPDILGGSGKSTTTTYKKGDKVSGAAIYKPEDYKKTTFEKTEKPFLVTCPLERAVVTHVSTITKDNTIYYEVSIENANANITGQMIFHYLSQSYVYKNQVIEKSYPIGVSSKHFYISSSKQQMQSLAENFEQFTNEQAQNNYKQSLDIMKNLSEKDNDKIYEYNQKLGEQYYKNARSVLGRGGETPVHKENAYPTANVNTANKNVTNAVQNVDQGKSTPGSTQIKTIESQGEKININTPTPSSNVTKNFQKSASNTLSSGLIGNEITI